MGAASSVELPEDVLRVDEKAAMALLGQAFDKQDFAAAADGDGTVARADFLKAISSAAGQHIIYCTTKAYGAPFPDAEGRPVILSVLAIDKKGTAMRIVQEVEFPKNTGGAMVLQLNKSKSRLFSVAGANGIAVFDVDMRDEGKVVGGRPPVCSPTTTESMPTPLGVFPAWLTVDPAEETVYSCNFFSKDVTALPFDKASCQCGAPIGVCTPEHP